VGKHGEDKEVLFGAIRSAVCDNDGYQDLEATLPAAFHDSDPLGRAQYLETMVFLSKYLLSSQEDRVAIGNSAEIRLHFIDHRLMEFLARVPVRLKVFGLNEKVLLKKIAAGLIQKEILSRAKPPHRAPIRESVLPTGESTPTPLSPECLRGACLFDQTKMAGLLKNMRTVSHASEVDGMALAGIFSAKIVYQEFVAGFPPAIQVSPGLLVDRKAGSANSA
jgi:asparagine synthase (glutamine-hydrolysing)